MSKLYVAYGSNLNLAQMACRCPTAKIYGTGLLNNWELIFRGSRTGFYATIRKKMGEFIPVVVWKIQDEDEHSLDIYEGYPTFYFKKNVMVNLSQGKRKAMVYIMDSSSIPGTPSDEYVTTIRQGYEDNELNMEYLEKALLLNFYETKKDVQLVL